MTEFKAVSISRNGFAFCRYTLAVLLWCAVLFKMQSFVLAAFVILLLSALLKVQRAPLIWLYTQTIDRVYPSKREIVNEKGLHFAHMLGTAFAGMCLLLLFFGNESAGWIVTFCFAIMKTFSALGYCSGLKLYDCMHSGNCCRAGKLVRKMKNVR